MMSVYKQMLPSLGGYLTRGAQVDLAKVEQFIQRIGSYEDAIFQKRMRLLARWVFYESQQSTELVLWLWQGCSSLHETAGQVCGHTLF